MGLAFIYPALPTCLVGYVQKSGFNLINVFCEEIVVKNVLCLVQCLLTGCIVHPRCTRIFQGCTNLMGCTSCVLFKNSHIVPRMSFAPAQCVKCSHILKPYLSGRVHFLSFPACLFVTLVRLTSRILLLFFKCNIREYACKKCLGTIALA